MTQANSEDHLDEWFGISVHKNESKFLVFEKKIFSTIC